MSAFSVGAIATAFVAEIRANIDRWYAEPNTPATKAAFDVRARAIWQRIEESGYEAAVLAIIRGDFHAVR